MNSDPLKDNIAPHIDYVLHTAEFSGDHHNGAVTTKADQAVELQVAALCA